MQRDFLTFMVYALLRSHRSDGASVRERYAMICYAGGENAARRGAIEQMPVVVLAPRLATSLFPRAF